MTLFSAPDARPVGEAIYVLGLMLTLCVAPASESFAQVQSVTVSKGIGHVQTSATDIIVSATGSGGGPYGFGADVDGQNISSISAPTVTGPINVGALGSFWNNGTLLYSTGDRGWRLGFPNADDWGSPTLSDLNSKFGSGTYIFAVNGVSIPLQLTGDAYPNAPLLTLSGGAWSNGKYVIDPSQPLTITTNAFSAYGSHQDDGIGIGIAGGSFVIPFSSVAPFGCGWCVARQSHSAVPDTNFLSYTVPAFSFASGQDYFIVAGFTALVDVNPNPALPGSQNVAYYSAHTILTLSAANPPAPPTPSTPLPPPTTDQSAYTASGGRIPATAVQVNATGTFGNASLSVILDIGQALQTTLATGLEVASTYNVYVVALVPGERLGSASPVWYVKPRAPGSWSPLQFPIAAFLENAAEGAANNQVLIEILIGNDLSSLVGTEFYIGYGLSDQEMLAAGRYRGVYKAQ